MEEIIIKNIKVVLDNCLNKYLDIYSNRNPSMNLIPAYEIAIGEKFVIDDYPTITIVPVSWNKRTPEITFCENDGMEILYRYRINIYLGGDDPTELEIRMMRYREAIINCIRDNYTLGGVVFGSIVTSVDIHNIMGSGQKLALGSSINYEAIGIYIDNEMVY